MRRIRSSKLISPSAVIASIILKNRTVGIKEELLIDESNKIVSMLLRRSKYVGSLSPNSSSF